MSIEAVMTSNHLIFCCPLLLLPAILPSIRVFSNELVVHTRWPKYWSFSFSICPSNVYSGFISFRINWFDPLLSKDSQDSTIWKYQFFRAQLSLWSSSHICIDYRITIALTTWTFVSKVMSLLSNMLLRFVIAFLPRTKSLNFMATLTTWERHCSENESSSQKVSSSHCGPLLWDSGPLSPNSFSNSPVISNKSLTAFVVLAVCSSPSL